MKEEKEVKEKEYLDYIKKMDCPSELIDLLEAKPSEWRRGVVKQFIEGYLMRKKIENKLKKLDWELTSIIGVLIFIAGLLLKSAFGV